MVGCKKFVWSDSENWPWLSNRATPMVLSRDGERESRACTQDSASRVYNNSIPPCAPFLFFLVFFLPFAIKPVDQHLSLLPAQIG